MARSVREPTPFLARSRFRPVILAALVATSLGGPLGCQPVGPELVSVRDVEPTSVHQGETLEILGDDLPVGQVSEVLVRFEGDLHRAGEPTERGVSIETRSAKLVRDRVVVDVEEALGAAMLGATPKHTTFRGHVSVHFPGRYGALSVFGTIKGVVALEFYPSHVTRQLQAQRARHTDESLLFAGLTLTQGDGADVSVASVAPESPADLAGLASGDRLVDLDGVTIASREDWALRGDGEPISVRFEREGELFDKALRTEGFRASSSDRVESGLVVLVTALVFTLLHTGRFAHFWGWLSHREAESAVGSSGVAPRKTGSVWWRDKWLPRVAVPVSFIGGSLAFLAIPVTASILRAPLDLAVAFLVGITAMMTATFVTGGVRGSGTTFGKRVRATVETLVFHIPPVASLVLLMAASGSSKVDEIVRNQGDGNPVFWGFSARPHLAVAFAFVGFVSMLARPKRGQPTVQGAIYSFFEWLHVGFIAAVFALAFLGGYTSPWSGPWERPIGALLFVLKCWLVVGSIQWVRRSFPAMLPELAQSRWLRRALPVTLIAGLIELGLRFFPPLPSTVRTVGWITLAVTMSWIVRLRLTRAPRSLRKLRLSPQL